MADRAHQLWIAPHGAINAAQRYGASVPATPDALNVNLIERLERRNLSVERILPLRGRVASVAELYATAGRLPAR